MTCSCILVKLLQSSGLCRSVLCTIRSKLLQAPEFRILFLFSLVKSVQASEFRCDLLGAF
jgi:hypothetical protein